MSIHPTTCLSACPPFRRYAFLAVCLPVRLSTRVPAWLPLRPSVCLPAYLPDDLSVYQPSLCFCMPLSVCLPAYQSRCLPACRPARLSPYIPGIFLFVRLPAWLCVGLFINRPVSLPVGPPTPHLLGVGSHDVHVLLPHLQARRQPPQQHRYAQEEQEVA